MEHNQTDNKLLYLLLFVLLLHLLALFYLLNKEHYTEITVQQKIEQLLEKQNKQPLTPQEEEQLLKWVSGAGAGAQVVFKDQDEINETEEKGTEQEQKESKADKKEVQEADKQKKEKQSNEQKEKIHQEEQPEDNNLMLENENTILKKIERTVTQNSTPGQDTESGEPKVSLADITQGFMKKMGEQSSHYVNALSNNQGRPTDEQIKIERYISKILKAYGDAEKIHYNKIIEIIKNNKSYKENVALSYVGFGLNRNGQLTKLFIEKSCGIKELDDMLMYIFKQASSSFPPIPSYIKINPFEFCIVFTLHLKPDQPNFRFTMN